MKQAIQTKFIPCSNTKPARIKAFCDRGSIFIGYYSIPDDILGLNKHEQSHVYAAKQLCAKFYNEDAKRGQNIQKNPWAGHFITGQLKNGDFVHVFTD